MSKRSAASAVLLALLVGCGSGGAKSPKRPLVPDGQLGDAAIAPDKAPTEKAPPREPPAKPAPTPVAPIDLVFEQRAPLEIKLLNAGKGKKQKLAFALTAGATFRTELGVDVSVDQGQGPQNMPTALLALTTTVTAVDKAGVASLAATIDGSSAADVAGAVVTVGQMQGQLAGLHGLIIETTRKPNGEVLKLRYRKDPATSETEPLLNSLLETNLPTLILPKDPIAPGASWKVSSSYDFQRLPMSRQITYTLVSVTGGKAVIKGVIAVSSPDHTEDDVTIKGVKGAGLIELELDLKTPWPMGTVVQTTELSFEQGDQKETLKLSFGNSMKPAPAATTTP